MNEEKDLLIFTNDEGEEVKLEVLEYFEFEEDEYALLIDPCQHVDKDHCHDSECECHGEETEVIVMRVVVDGDVEEFIPVEEDKLDDIVEFLQKSLDEEDELFNEEDED